MVNVKIGTISRARRVRPLQSASMKAFGVLDRGGPIFVATVVYIENTISSSVTARVPSNPSSPEPDYN